MTSVGTAAAAAVMTTGQSLVSPSREAGGTFIIGEGRTVVPGNSTMSPKNTGATVHHHGPTDPRESPFAHLRSQLQSAALQDPSRLPVSIVSERRLSSDSSADTDVQPCKRIKLEPTCDVSSPSFYRTLYVNSRENELLELRSSYQDHIMELFFLENNGNLMDYIPWSKRPNIHLSRLLQSASLDNADETKTEDEVCHSCYVDLSVIIIVQPFHYILNSPICLCIYLFRVCPCLRMACH